MYLYIFIMEANKTQSLHIYISGAFSWRYGTIMVPLFYSMKKVIFLSSIPLTNNSDNLIPYLA